MSYGKCRQLNALFPPIPPTHVRFAQLDSRQTSKPVTVSVVSSISSVGNFTFAET